MRRKRLCSEFFTRRKVYAIFTTESAVRSIIFRQKSAQYLIPMDMRRLKLLLLNILKFSAERLERFHPRIFINFLTVKETLWYYVRTLPRLFPEPAPLISIQSRKLSHCPIQETLSLITPVIRDV